MRRFLIGLLMASLLLAALVLPAAANDPDIQLSRDGVTWGPGIAEPLFDPAMRWVPGDSETSSFYVRNNGGSLGDLTIDVVAGLAGELIDSGDLRITAMGGGGQWETIDDGGQHRLLAALDLADGKVAAITVMVSFEGDSLGVTQLESAPLKFVVTLSRAASLNVPGDPDVDEGSGGDGRPSAPANVSDQALPDTGAPAMAWILALAAILIGSGSALVADRRNEARDV